MNLHAEVVDSGHVKAELISSVDKAVPGQSFKILLRQKIHPGWHTYWRNPGDSGAPTTLAWELPEGVSAGPIEWPWPERIVYGPLMNFGYEGEVLFPVEISIDSSVQYDEIELRALGSWLVCEEICIPEDAMLSLTLPIGDRANLTSQNLFTRARSKIPTDPAVDAKVDVTAAGIELAIDFDDLSDSRLESVSYFSYERDLIENAAPQPFEITSGVLKLKLRPGYEFKEDANFDGIVVVSENDGQLNTAFVVSPVNAGVNSGVNPSVDPGSEPELDLITAIMFALLGGLILNLMPCVFPVLSIKILSLISHVEGDAGRLRKHGYVYSLGVVLSFIAIALVLIGLREGGAQIGWGFQLQSPVVIAFLAYLFALIGLNLFGFFEVGTGLMGFGQTAGGGVNEEGGESYKASFGTGVLATVVAAPCTAPFMAGAVGFALTRESHIAVAIFGALGLGMALPYLLLCYSPRLLKRMPRPGPWMVRFKEFLAFPMFASVIWLVWVLSQQTGSNGVLLALTGVLSLGVAIWLWQHRPTHRAGRGLVSLMSLSLVASALYIPTLLQSGAGAASVSGSESSSRSSSYVGPKSEPYSPEALEAALELGPVFVNFTAAWCITCKVNEKVALDSTEIREAFAKNGITYLKGDWTREDPMITAALAQYQRSGVPLYLLYGKGNKRAQILPQVLTKSILLNALKGV